MRPPFRSKQEVIIDAPLEAVWSFSVDLTKIPEFHPRVFKVDLIDGKAFREPGVSYQCHLSGGAVIGIQQYKGRYVAGMMKRPINRRWARGVMRNENNSFQFQLLDYRIQVTLLVRSGIWIGRQACQNFPTQENQR